MKVSLDDESKELFKSLNDNLEALIIQTKESNRLTSDFLDFYQKMIQDKEGR